MPPQTYWESLFDIAAILDAFGFAKPIGDVAELGCGCGTFSLPVAQRIGGTLFAFDIEPEMVATTAQRAAAAGVQNLRPVVRDVLTSGFGLPAESCSAVLLFNILHAEEPGTLLRAARDVLRPDGFVAVIHWRSDIATPRGPALDIRPRPDQIAAWGRAAGLKPQSDSFLLPPWHFGLKLGAPLA
jgi:SAM-dependent methyltransferase